MDSILDSVKLNVGLDSDYDEFDHEILTNINSVFATLNQLGIGPEDGYEITGDTETWDDYLQGNLKYSSVKSYICLKVQMIFDPPSTGYLVAAREKQIDELTWRLNTVRETTQWVNPNPGYVGPHGVDEGELILDGGSA